MVKILTFKKHLTLLYKKNKILFNHQTSRKIQIVFTQLRMGFSNLNHDLFVCGCTNDSKCKCGSLREDCNHYLMNCALYNIHRDIMFLKIQSICSNLHPTAGALLYGFDSLSADDNLKMFSYVHKFIEQICRFELAVECVLSMYCLVLSKSPCSALQTAIILCYIAYDHNVSSVVLPTLYVL